MAKNRNVRNSEPAHKAVPRKGKKKKNQKPPFPLQFLKDLTDPMRHGNQSANS